MSRLAAERSQLLAAVSSRSGRVRPTPGVMGTPRGAAGASPDAPEWDLRRIRNALLLLGSSLLVLSAIGFAGFEWTRLGPSGRSAVLALVTLGACCAGLLLRRRLPATAEALSALGQLLVVVEWALLRQSGVESGLATETWWALGSLLIAAIGLGLGWRGLTAGRVIGAAAAALALPLLISMLVPLSPLSSGRQLTHLALWMAIVTVELVVARWLWNDSRWHASAAVGALAAAAWQAVAWTRGLLLAVEVVTRQVRPAPLAGLAIATTAAGPCLVRYLWNRELSRRAHGDACGSLAVFAGAASLMGGALVGLSAALTLGWLAVALICMAATVLLAARLLPPSIGRGIVTEAVVAAASGGLVLVSPALVAVFGPLGWWTHGWTGSLSWLAARHVSGPVPTASRRPVGAMDPSSLSLAGLGALSACVVAVTEWSSARGGRRSAACSARRRERRSWPCSSCPSSP